MDRDDSNNNIENQIDRARVGSAKKRSGLEKRHYTRAELDELLIFALTKRNKFLLTDLINYEGWMDEEELIARLGSNLDPSYIEFYNAVVTDSQTNQDY